MTLIDRDELLKHISIHALREEGDTAGGTERWLRKNFYPRPPRGGRHERRVHHVLY